jgi:putative ABC transport system permease protein
LLVLVAFTILGASAAAPPMFAEAAGNASFADALSAVPENAAAADGPAVRIIGSTSPRSVDHSFFVRQLRDIPDLTVPALTGSSVGAETAQVPPWRSTIRVGSQRSGARLFMQDQPARALVVVDRATPATQGGIWLPQPLATELGIVPGQRVTFAVSQGPRSRSATVVVAGSYAVARDGRTPADATGARTWAAREGDLPTDPDFRTLPAYLVVTDVKTGEALADQTGDRILWAVESQLGANVDLAHARRVAAALDALRSAFLSANPPDSLSNVVQPNVISGIPTIVDSADEVAAVTKRRTTSLEVASLLLGLAAVTALAVLGLGRRRIEVRHAVASGLAPATISGQWVAEFVAPAVLGTALGVGIGRLLVGVLGPEGQLTGTSLRVAGLNAAAAAAAGLAGIAIVVFATAAAVLRPQNAGAPARRVPWIALLVVAAVTATGGLLGADPDQTAPRGLDLLVPLLVAAAVGSAVTVALLRLAGLSQRSRQRSAGRPAGLRLPAWLALRRLAAPNRARVLVTTATATGLGMLLFALSAVSATTTSIDDRVSVQAGANAVAEVPSSWRLDDHARLRPAPPKPGEDAPPPGLVPGVRTPPLPRGTAVVWRYQVNTPTDNLPNDLLVADPQRLLAAARWGSGSTLAAARQLTGSLAAAGRRSVRAQASDFNAAVPVIAVATTGLAVGDEINVEGVTWTARLRVVGRTDAYPGLAQRPMFVAPVNAMFAHLGVLDPRLRPRPKGPSGPDGGPVQTTIWTSRGVPGVQAALAGKDVRASRLDTAAQARLQPIFVAVDRAKDYQLALGSSLALLAVLAMARLADRAASRGQATDVLLARVGLQRAGVRAARALEAAYLSIVALVGALVGVAVLLPLGARLLDFDPSLPPGLELQLSWRSVGVVAIVAAVAAVVASVVGAARSASGSEEVALRGNE